MPQNVAEKKRGEAAASAHLKTLVAGLKHGRHAATALVGSGTLKQTPSWSARDTYQRRPFKTRRGMGKRKRRATYSRTTYPSTESQTKILGKLATLRHDMEVKV